MTQKEYIRLIAMLVIGIVIGFGTSLLVNRDNDAGTNGISGEVSVTQQNPDTANAILVKDQLAGKTVIVENVTLANPGWVAIHDNVNGTPGRILGAALFDKGQHAGVVTLLRATAANTSYFAVIHSDDGDFKNFNAKTDTVLTSNGTPVMVEFKATALQTSPAVSATPTPVSTSTINIKL